MRLIVILMALACAMPAAAQQPNGLDPTGDVAAKLEEQQRDGAAASQALREGEFKLARKYATRVTGAAPENIGGWLLLGQAETGLKDWKAASRTYATAARVRPSSAEAHGGLGVALARRGDTTGAAKQLAWLTARAQTCGARCSEVAKLKVDVEAAIAAGATAG